MGNILDLFKPKKKYITGEDILTKVSSALKGVGIHPDKYLIYKNIHLIDTCHIDIQQVPNTLTKKDCAAAFIAVENKNTLETKFFEIKKLLPGLIK